MNIIYIHQHFSTTRGTTGTRSYDFARLLAARGHQVTVLTSDREMGSLLPGDAGLVHRLRGRASSRRLAPELRARILARVEACYP